MSYANPTAIKSAIDNGATYSGGMLVESGTAKYLKLTDGVWSLDENTGVLLFNRAHFNMIANNIVLSDPGEYQYCIAEDASTIIGQLAIANGKAMILDP